MGLRHYRTVLPPVFCPPSPAAVLSLDIMSASRGISNGSLTEVELVATTTVPIRSLDVDRHGGEKAPTNPVPKPQLGSGFNLDQGVIDGEYIFMAIEEE